MTIHCIRRCLNTSQSNSHTMLGPDLLKPWVRTGYVWHHSFMINAANHFNPDPTSIKCTYMVFDLILVCWIVIFISITTPLQTRFGFGKSKVSGVKVWHHSFIVNNANHFKLDPKIHYRHTRCLNNF